MSVPTQRVSLVKSHLLCQSPVCSPVIWKMMTSVLLRFGGGPNEIRKENGSKRQKGLCREIIKKWVCIDSAYIPTQLCPQPHPLLQTVTFQRPQAAAHSKPPPCFPHRPKTHPDTRGRIVVSSFLHRTCLKPDFH